AVGQFQVDRAAGLPQCRGPRLDVRDVAGAHTVDLHVVHAPGGELVRPGVDELLRARPGVVDADHALAVVVLLRCRGGDVGGVVRGALDGRVAQHRLVRDAGRDVQAELQALGVHVVGDHVDAVGGAAGRELRRVGDPPAVPVHVRPLAARADVPEVVEVDVAEPDPVQAAGDQRVGLRLDLRGGGRLADEAPTAPAQRRRPADAPGRAGR